MPDTIKGEIEESLAPATEELVSWVIEPNGTEIADLIRRFPGVADLLRETAHYLVLEPTAILASAEDGPKPLSETRSNGVGVLFESVVGNRHAGTRTGARYLPAIRGRPEAAARAADRRLVWGASPSRNGPHS